MGMYLVSVGRQEWFSDDEGLGGKGAIASAFNEELRLRGLPPYESVPELGPALWFEEKLSLPMTGFSALCRAHLTPEEEETLCGWSEMVPISLDEEITLPVGGAYTVMTVVAGAPQVLAAAERLASAIGLPPEVPQVFPNLGLTMWFLDGQAKDLAATRPGPWSEDLNSAFYAALYLRAAQHSLRCGVPLSYS
ncbi:hypothetical protein [Streptomyces sp. V4I2]|uniref:hypothetical protein n=1 Tax=Streptomyces sp. V4I2 TaxID=3042280 RepID=UPI0027836889|nr:hypothetical protein [Streptomyces sp. V4I2]MDQ1050480.1 hypothetical protein [Streptomyces sp. V4I2]